MHKNLRNISSKHKIVDEERKEKLTRKEKKTLEACYYKKNHKLKKYEVSKENTEVLHRCKSRKYNKKLRKINQTTRVFSKAESIFNKWLKENSDRFNTKLMKKSSFEFYFEGVTKNVILFTNNMPEVGVSFDYDFNFDTVYMGYIGDEAFNPQKGYYDADRLDNQYTYYQTREELYINEVFEKMLTYCNKNITPQNSLYLFDFWGGTAGHIDSTQEDNSNNRKMTRDLQENTSIKMTEEEAVKALENGEIYKVIKIDLFDTFKEPLIRYYATKKEVTL